MSGYVTEEMMRKAIKEMLRESAEDVIREVAEEVVRDIAEDIVQDVLEESAEGMTDEESYELQRMTRLDELSIMQEEVEQLKAADPNARGIAEKMIEYIRQRKDALRN